MGSYLNDQKGAPYQGAVQPDDPSMVRVPASMLQSGTDLNRHLTDPLRNFKFMVTIDHQPSNTSRPMTAGIGFMSVSGLAATTEAIPYREGGMNTTVHQLPGQTSFSPITLQRGVTLTGNAWGTWTWFRQLFDVVGGQGTGPGNHSPAGNKFRADVTINVLEHPITHLSVDDSDLVVPSKLKVLVRNAWITGISFSDLNAGDNAVMVEQMTLVHEGFQVSYASAAAYASAGNIGGATQY